MAFFELRVFDPFAINRTRVMDMDMMTIRAMDTRAMDMDMMTIRDMDTRVMDMDTATTTKAMDTRVMDMDIMNIMMNMFITDNKINFCVFFPN